MTVRGWRVRWKHTPPDAPMGRFGGGWQWAVGVKVGGAGTILVELLVGSLIIDRPDPPDGQMRFPE